MGWYGVVFKELTFVGFLAQLLAQELIEIGVKPVAIFSGAKVGGIKAFWVDVVTGQQPLAQSMSKRRRLFRQTFAQSVKFDLVACVELDTS